MPTSHLPLHYDSGIKIGDDVLIRTRQRVYHKIYVTGGMSFFFGITRFSEYDGMVGRVTRKDRQTYIGRTYETFQLAGIPYVFPPWLVKKVLTKPSWEV